MYVNVLFSLPETTKLEIRHPMSFFSSDNPLKRIISVMHNPGGEDGTAKLVVNLVSMTLGTPLKVLRSVMGARFIQGEASDPTQLSVCSFRIDVMKKVEESTKRHLEQMEMLRTTKEMRESQGKSRGFNSYASNLCREVLLPGGPEYPTTIEATNDSTEADRQQLMDYTRRNYFHTPLDLDTTAEMVVRDRRFDARGLYYNYAAGVSRRVAATAREPDTRQAQLYADFAAGALLSQMEGDGFVRRMMRADTQATREADVAAAAAHMAREEDRRFIELLSSRSQIHAREYDRLVRGTFAMDYDGDSFTPTAVTSGTITYRTEDRRPHLPQNHRNRGPVPRNQRW